MEINVKTDSKSTLVGAFVPAGSRNEASHERGVAHFLEHFLFKGTPTRTKNDIHRAVERYGAEFNAWTSEEHTFYYSIISNEYVECARDLIHDMVTNPALPQAELDKERLVIMQELEMYHDDPCSSVFDESQKILFQESSGLHIPILGTRESLAGINTDILRDFHQRNYKNPIYLTIGGAVENEERYKLYAPKKFHQQRTHLLEDSYITKRPGITQANIVETGLLYLDTLPEEFMLRLFTAIMNGFSGRLFNVIREEHGLAYSSSFYYQRHSCGTTQYWGFAGLMPETVDAASHLITEQLCLPVTEAELEFAKRKLLGQIDLCVDDKLAIARNVINGTLNHTDYWERLRKYKKIVESISHKDMVSFQERACFDCTTLVGILPE